jgi:hypothetical protein
MWWLVLWLWLLFECLVGELHNALIWLVGVGRDNTLLSPCDGSAMNRRVFTHFVRHESACAVFVLISLFPPFYYTFLNSFHGIWSSWSKDEG